MVDIVASKFVVPPFLSVSSAQAEGTCGGYRVLANTRAASYVPFPTDIERLRNRKTDDPFYLPLPFRLPDEQRTRYWQGGNIRIATAPQGVSACDLGVDAAKALLAPLTADQRGEIDAIIYCHNTLDERIAESSAGRIAWELGLIDRLCFSITQVHNCAVFAALQMAYALIEGAEALRSVLIVAADKWLYPYVRSFGRLGCFGDGGGALLLNRGNNGGLEIIHIDVANAQNIPNVFDPGTSLAEEPLAQRVAAAITETLRDSGHTADQIDLVIPQNYEEKLIHLVNDYAGLGKAALYLEGLKAHGHLSSADTIANLAGATGNNRHRDSKLMLLWGAGLNGEAACCLVRRHPSRAT